MTKDEALKLALEALNDLAAWTDGEVGGHMDEPYSAEVARRTITAIKEALAEQEREPVAFINVEQRKLEWAKYMSWDTPTVVNLPKIPLFTTPPQRTWVNATTWRGLTDEEIKRIGKLDLDSNYFGLWYDFARAIEAALKEKNT